MFSAVRQRRIAIVYTMASLTSRAVNLALSYLFAAERRKSLDEELINIRDNKDKWPEQTPPKKIVNDPSSEVSIEFIDPKMSSTGGEYRWPIYHVRRKRDGKQDTPGSQKPILVVHFHAGAFYLPVSSLQSPDAAFAMVILTVSLTCRARTPVSSPGVEFRSGGSWPRCWIRLCVPGIYPCPLCYRRPSYSRRC